ncbi:uncharacterized protein At5g41620-like isoform X1 [Selaginella moellendorffii]|nr:uncharacterized protein At5g41620-like isoform X1 [Selaginella moellendorffii]|eukprot:XP_024528658.1 uncharacterized protein At5g41620-like isoform X1 [Selaginella moellendorffii]
MRRNKAGASITLHPQHHKDSRDREIAAIWRPTSLRMKRGVSGAHRGPTTPVPSWKLYENPFYSNVIQAGASVSARKLAASLWELQEIPLPRSPAASPDSAATSSPPAAPPRSSAESPKSSLSLPPPPAKRKSSPAISSTASALEEAAKSTDGNGKIAHTNRQLAAMQSHINRCLDKQATAVKSSIAKSNSNNASDSASQASPETKIVASPDGFSASPELLERLHALEEQHSGAALASALRTELDVARSKVKELEGANKLARKEIEALLKKIADDKAGSFGKEQDRVKQALLSVRDEADEERKSKRRMEMANKKLSRELGEAKMALSKVLQELEKERKARELMEDVCDELAREIGEDKAEVEELKRESLRIRQEVEEERRMLHMAEAWREERVHMKLAEARDEIQEKLDLVEKIKGKLEEFLRVRRRVLDDGDYASQQADIRDGEMLRASVDSLLSQERESLKQQSETRRSEEVESLDDDLHSIDLTKDAASAKERRLAEWHRLKTDRRIYCSPESRGEIGDDGGSGSSSSTSGSGSSGSISTGRSSSSRAKKGPPAKVIAIAPLANGGSGSLGTLTTKSIGSNLGSSFDNNTGTAESSEFDLPLRTLGRSIDKPASSRMSSSNNSNWSPASVVANGKSRKLKSLVEWTTKGGGGQPANGGGGVKHFSKA